MQFDVFNGDADGICSLLQLRLTHPLASQRVTGVKRDIALLDRVSAGAGDQITVLDISMAKNKTALERLLSAGAAIDYVDHHSAGDIPQHDNLSVTISEAPEVCTALLINGRLHGAHVEWAVTGAFGDNLDEPARQIASKASFAESSIIKLKELGVCVNYNGYGPSLEDLHFHPEALYEALYAAATPEAFIGSDEFRTLRDGYLNDIAVSLAIEPLIDSAAFAVYQLPNAAWARRVSGVFSNDLVRAHPARAHAVLTEQDDGAFLVSVRAPFHHRFGAEKVCAQFETGGGRAAAAGINRLAAGDLDRLIVALAAEYGDQR
ncbi:MAG: DHH family phosphoesterase [Luminiphilus sp.]|nr:DHH family phosphoesterase [Luminiphilus sp.]